MYEISDNVPMPDKATGGVGKYPWRLLKVGGSFFVPRTDYKTENYRPHPAPALGIKVMTRKTCENNIWGVRVWRIA